MKVIGSTSGVESSAPREEGSVSRIVREAKKMVRWEYFVRGEHGIPSWHGGSDDQEFVLA